MRVCIVIRRRDRKLPEEILQEVLGELGYRVSFQESLPEQPIDPGGILLVDAREMQRELLARLAALADRKIAAHILALTRKEERTYRKIHLLEAGVEMIVPWDAAHLKYHLSIALSELFGGPDER
jgi:hypothetical protein